jgi:glutamine transport system ATP-binding protein
VIEFKNVSKHFGPTVLHDIDLKINQGEVVVIIGPSGSGKSTLLRCINKLEEITSGDLIVDGLKVNDPKVDERLIRQEAGMVFQQFYLFPHLTALENVMLARCACAAPSGGGKTGERSAGESGPRGTCAPLPF